MGDTYIAVFECARWMSGITCGEMRAILLEAGCTVIRYNGEDWGQVQTLMIGFQANSQITKK